MSNTNIPRHAVYFVIITVALESVGFGIIIPVMPQLITSLTGEGVSQAAFYGGWLLFSYAVMQFAFAPVMGNLGDRFGRRPVLLLSMFVLGIDYLVMALAPTLFWLFIGRIMAGIAGSSYSTANAYVADISSDKNRAQNFGLIGAAFGVGFVIGPAIGGFLGEYGPRAPFYAAAILSFLNAIYGYTVLKESLAKENRRPFQWQRANPFGAFTHLKSNKTVFAIGSVVFIYGLAHQSLPSVWSYYTTQKFAWSESQIGFSLAFAGVTMIVVQAFLIRLLMPILGNFRAGVIGMIAMTLGYTGYALSTQGWQLYLCIAVASFSGLIMPALQSIMTSKTNADSQGELQGAVAAVMSLTAIVGPLVMTGLFREFSQVETTYYFPGAAFLTAAILQILALVVFIAVTAKAKNP